VTARQKNSFDWVRRDAGRVGVLMGGSAAERDISLRSGRAVTAALVNGGIDATAIDWGGRLDRQLLDYDYDRYFIALHGRGGEDGQIQAALDLLGKPYTGTRVLGCALAMDKYRTKLAWSGAGLPTPPCVVVTHDWDAKTLLDVIGLPLMIKPAREGSSIGISKVTRADQLSEAVALARSYDELVIAERYIDGDEYTLSIAAGQALPIIKLETPHEFYDYAAKYSADSTRYLCPCGLDLADEQAAAALALHAFNVSAGHGWGRIDFMRDRAGRNWLIELNTVPGMTDHSLVPMAARQAGFSFEDLVLMILASSFPAEAAA
jgi:D-alanine-D-alanine ligase